KAGEAAADMVHVAAGAGDLAGQYPVVALAPLAQVVADDGLGGAVGLAAGWHWVHLGTINEVDAGVPRSVDLGKGIALGILLAPGHGAQTQVADFQGAGAERAI